jgi:hypothetical protein
MSPDVAPIAATTAATEPPRIEALLHSCLVPKVIAFGGVAGPGLEPGHHDFQLC